MQLFKEKLKNKKFMVYGAGWGGFCFIQNFCKPNNLFPYLVLDKKFKKEGKFLGIPAANPETYNFSTYEKKHSVVVIAIFKKTIVREVINFLKRKGIKRILILPPKFRISIGYFQEKWNLKVFKNGIGKSEKNLKISFESERVQKRVEKVLKNFNNFILLHIGWEKTGSTSIQFSLWGHKEKNFYYADGEIPDHNFLIFLEDYLEEHPWIKIILEEEKRKKKKEAIGLLIEVLKSINKAAGRVLILSGEGIPFLREESLKFFRQFFLKFYPEVVIYGYIREPFGFISSIFQEWLKVKFLNFFCIKNCYFSYKKFFAKFYKIFGEENVILKKFDTASFPGGCVVRDFCETWGIRLPKKRIVRVNESLPKEVVSCVYIFRKCFVLSNIQQIHVYFIASLLRELLPNYFFTPFKISKEVIKPIVEENIEDVRWMESVLGEPLIDEEALKEPEPPWVVKTEEDLLTVPDEVVDALRNYTNYKLSNTKSIPQQVAEMLYQILKENFPDI